MVIIIIYRPKKSSIFSILEQNIHVKQLPVQPIDAVHKVLLNILSEQNSKMVQSESESKIPRGTKLKNKTCINITEINVADFNKEKQKNNMKKNKKALPKGMDTKSINSKKKYNINIAGIDDEKENDKMDYELNVREQLHLAIENTASITNIKDLNVFEILCED